MVAARAFAARGGVCVVCVCHRLVVVGVACGCQNRMIVHKKAACKRFTGRFFMDVIPLLPLFPFNDGLRIVADECPFTVHDVQLQVHAAAAQGLYGLGRGG